MLRIYITSVWPKSPFSRLGLPTIQAAAIKALLPWLIVLFGSLNATVYGQNTLNDSLLFYEYNYFKSDNDSAKQLILLKKIRLYLKENITEREVFTEIKRVNINSLHNNDLKANFLWNAAALSYLNNETDHARFFLAEYSALKEDSSTAFNLLSILVNKYTDTNEVNKRMKYLRRDTLFKGLSCFCEMTNYNRKHLNFYLISSAILPGSGTIMNGYVFKGLVSLALTAASVFGIVKLIEYGLYLNAVLWGTGVGLKFYAGNIKLTEKVFYKAENRKKNKLANNCELKLKNVLIKYPITLKEL